MIGANAHAAHTLQVTHDTSASKIASQLSLRLPRYEQLKTLSPETQRKVIESLQAFLIQADEDARKSGDQSAFNDLNTLKMIYELWIETAEAKTKARVSHGSRGSAEQQPYCINQGVVKPISDCDTKLGYKMHDFDTNEILSKIGPASQCPSGQKPCSPVFGFTSDGQMFCSSKNLTRDCAQQAKQPGTLSVVNVMAGCQAGSPGVAKVDCKALGEFLDQQISVVEGLCQKAPKRLACGILRDKVNEVVTEASEKKAASEKIGLDKVAEVVKATNDAAQMSPSAAPCPPEAVAAPSAPTPPQTNEPAQAKAPAPGDKIQCTQKNLTKNLEKPTLDALTDELMGGKPDEFICGALNLPNKSGIALNRIQGTVVVKATADAKPVTLDFVEAQIIGTISNALLEDPYKVPAKDLLSHYLPKEEMKDAGKITAESKDGKSKKEFPSKGWVTPDGTRIRYVPSVNFGTDSKPMVMVAIQPGGKGKEHITGVEVSLPEAAEAAAQGAAPAASAASKDARAPASQPK
jgi:hypothetical protein